jgi:hypothetical protein
LVSRAVFNFAIAEDFVLNNFHHQFIDLIFNKLSFLTQILADCWKKSYSAHQPPGRGRFSLQHETQCEDQFREFVQIGHFRGG